MSVSNEDTSFTMISSQLSSCWLIRHLPNELHVNILTYLRAYDLSAVQRTCRFFARPLLIEAIVQHTAQHVYPPELTQGHDTPIVSGGVTKMTYEALRNMEMLVVARLLSRPEPRRGGGFYVSKSWCRTALQWLEVQQHERELQEQQQVRKNTTPKKGKKLTKKQQRIRNRRLSDASPPWPNINSDILCEHSNLSKAKNAKQARARAKVLDKQAWKVLKKLYPDSTQLDAVKGECLQCALQVQVEKKEQAKRDAESEQERKMPLSCHLVRGFYTRKSRGVPCAQLLPNGQPGSCPLQPGLYVVLPRAWCHAWRKYIKHGSVDGSPCAPNATALLCDAHRLPLIPPHLESYLYGKTSSLLSSSSNNNSETNVAAATTSNVAAMRVVGLNPVEQQHDNIALDDDIISSLRAVGMTSSEVASQQMAMMTLQRNNSQNTNIRQIHDVAAAAHPQQQRTLDAGQQLDRENKVVVEVLADDEYTALQKWWPKSHSNFILRFAIDDVGSVHWSTAPCRECDASRHTNRSDLYVRNRARGWVKRSSTIKKSAPASLEY